MLRVDTNISKSTTTDDRGSYLFNDLQPGVYKVTIEATSFKTVSQRDVRIDANAVRRVDVELQASGVSEAVEITASGVVLQTGRTTCRPTGSMTCLSARVTGGPIRAGRASFSAASR